MVDKRGSVRLPDGSTSEVEFGPDVDLETEAIIDADGVRVDEAYVDAVVDAVHRRLGAPGRPSLTGRAGRSPRVNARLSDEAYSRLRHRAEVEGTSVSELVRQAVEEFIDG